MRITVDAMALGEILQATEGSDLEWKRHDELLSLPVAQPSASGRARRPRSLIKKNALTR